MAPGARRRTVFLGGAALLLCTLAGSACGGKQHGPSVLGVRLESAEGGVVQLAEHRGDILVLHLFATWSDGSAVDAARLSALHQSEPKGVTIIGIALDLEGSRLVRPWRKATGATYPITLASDAVRAGQTPLGRVQQVPTTILVDRDGRIVGRVERSLLENELEEAIAELRD